MEDIFIQPANVERLYLKLSPVGLYDAATQAWSGTDLLGIRDFFAAVRRHRHRVIDYFYDEEIFRSRQWFSADKGAAAWSNLPAFSFQRVDVNVNAKRALPDVSLLFLMNLALFIVIFLMFVRSEGVDMILHITKRELYDNLNSLRFALATVLLIGLMLTNAIVHLREHPKRVQNYHNATNRYQNRLASYAEDSLYKLAEKGPGYLYKQPSDLRFCAEGGETFLPGNVEAGFSRWGRGDEPRLERFLDSGISFGYP